MPSSPNEAPRDPGADKPQDQGEEDWTAYPHLKRAGGGKIVNIGSMMSLFGASFVAPYGASKGGIVQLTRAPSCAWAKDNIQVNAVRPGWIDTALTRQARKDIAGLHERVLARTPAARWGAA